jgi:hypothetical protein
MEHREDERENEMDRLLRRSLATPIPRLPPDFDQRLMSEMLQSSLQLDRHRQILLAGYGLVSVVVSAVLMRDQGLGWGVVAGLILAPLALIVAVRSADRTHK